MARLQGKFALVTGGTAGIGLEAARRFVAEGAAVAITGRDETALKAAVADLGGDVVTIRSDASSVPDQKALAAELGERRDRLEVLYIDAADVTYLPVEDVTEEAFDRAVATNVTCPYFLVQALLPLLTTAGSASIVLCGSAAVYTGHAASSIYAASKAGLTALARALSSELIGRGIRVNTVTPGPTATTALSRMGLSDEQVEAMRAQIAQTVPVKRLADPVELANAVLFLASGESSFVVGTELIVDGGSISIQN